MSCLEYRGDSLFIENVSLEAIANQYGTPCYLYSRRAIETNWQKFTDAFKSIPNRICYAVKANSNLAILNLFAKMQSGFDIVSVGELERVLKAGGDPNKIVFSGVGKRSDEIERALQARIHCFDIESEAELIRLNNIAKRLNLDTNVALRINPDVDPHTHSHISTGLKENKFGIEMDEVIPLAQQITSMPNLNLIGIAAHIGSQITELNPFLLAIDRLIEIYREIKKTGIEIQEINLGGGLGIYYHHDTPPPLTDYANLIINKLKPYPLHLVLEPGRALVGNAGVLLTRVEYIKAHDDKKFAIVDAGMNDFIRPALYDAWQPILAIKQRGQMTDIYDVAGPVCESADFLGRDRELCILPNDLLAVDCAGAYGFSMSSNYNSRPRPAEVLVDGEKTYLIRSRETIADLFSSESIIQQLVDS